MKDIRLVHFDNRTEKIAKYHKRSMWIYSLIFLQPYVIEKTNTFEELRDKAKPSIILKLIDNTNNKRAIFEFRQSVDLSASEFAVDLRNNLKSEIVPVFRAFICSTS